MEKYEFFKTADNAYGILLSSGKVSLCDLNLVFEENIHELVRIPGKEIPSYIRDALIKIKELREKRIELSRKEEDAKGKLALLIKEKDAVEDLILDCEHERRKLLAECQKNSDAISYQVAEEKEFENCTGEEVLKMSFYDSSLERARAAAIIRKSKRPIVYTHGYGWKNPTTYRKSIDKETALSIVRDTGNYLDIQFEEKEIHVNTFSGNDLY